MIACGGQPYQRSRTGEEGPGKAADGLQFIYAAALQSTSTDSHDIAATDNNGCEAERRRIRRGGPATRSDGVQRKGQGRFGGHLGRCRCGDVVPLKAAVRLSGSVLSLCLSSPEGGTALRPTTRGQRQQWRRRRRPFAKKGMHDCLPGEQRPVMIHGVDGRKYGVTGLGLGRGRRPARETPAPDLRSGGTPRKTAGATGHGAVGGRAIGFEAARRGGGCVGGASRERELGKKARRPPTRRKSGDAGKGKKGKKRNIT